MRLSNSRLAVCAFGLISLVGCGSSNLPSPDATATGTDKGPKFKGPPSDAGLEVKPNSDATQFKKLVATNGGRFGHRSNPFALNSTEKAFDQQQASERVFSSEGFSTLVDMKPEVTPQIYVEPQPYRRLSGIVVGDSVVAIIEMGQGQEAQIVRPGQKIPNSPWTVVSIDQEKAILHRDGNVLPHDISVRLEEPPPGYGPANTGTTPGTGFPGGPGNFPGRGNNGGGRFPGGGSFPGGRFPGGASGKGGGD